MRLNLGHRGPLEAPARRDRQSQNESRRHRGEEPYAPRRPLESHGPSVPPFPEPAPRPGRGGRREAALPEPRWSVRQRLGLGDDRVRRPRSRLDAWRVGDRAAVERGVVERLPDRRRERVALRRQPLDRGLDRGVGRRRSASLLSSAFVDAASVAVAKSPNGAFSCSYACSRSADSSSRSSPCGTDLLSAPGRARARPRRSRPSGRTAPGSSAGGSCGRSTWCESTPLFATPGPTKPTHVLPISSWMSPWFQANPGVTHSGDARARVRRLEEEVGVPEHRRTSASGSDRR